MGGESAEAWRAVLDDLIKRGLPVYGDKGYASDEKKRAAEAAGVL